MERELKSKRTPSGEGVRFCFSAPSAPDDPGQGEPAFDGVMATPLPGEIRLGLRFSEKGLASVDFLPAGTPLRRPRNAVFRSIADQLQRYFDDARTSFDVTLDVGGTPYQRRVWRALVAIPAGELKTYGQLAEEIASGPRAVASACRANPVPIIVPCHRVVAAAGLGGYMGCLDGDPLKIKQWLLRHEGAL